MYKTILFTDETLATAGMVVVEKNNEDGRYGIVRHDHKQGMYVHAFELKGNEGFQPLHYDVNGMEVQDAIDHLE